MELEDEEKEDPNCREYDCRRAARSKKCQAEDGGGKQGQKVEKQCSGWTAGGIVHQDGAGRPCVWSPVTGEGATRPHAHSRAGAWTASCRRRAARDGACEAGCRQGCHRRVDRPRAPRNMWCSAGEELPGKSPATVTTAAGGDEKEIRRREGDRNETRSLENKIRFSSLALISCEERKNKESLILLFP